MIARREGVNGSGDRDLSTANEALYFAGKGLDVCSIDSYLV